MKILFVSQYFYPENFRINDLAFELVKRGHEVTVLTGEPNYPRGDFYEGYGILKKQREKVEGVDIHRVPVIPRKTGKLMLCLNYVSFVVMACIRARLMNKHDYDVIYAFGTSPITQAMPALTMKKRCGARVIVNVQDLWPDNVTAITGLKNPLIIGLLDKLVDGIYNRCDVILGTSRSFVKAIKARKGLIEKRKVGYWPQYAVVEKSNQKRVDLLPENVFHIVFTGNVGEGQGLDMVVEAAAIIKQREIHGLCFDIVGDGRARAALMESVESKGLSEYVKFHGSFPESEIPGILNCASAALLILKEEPIFEKTIPAKLQTYLACGCAVFGCVHGESKRLIEENKLGLCTRSHSGEALAETAIKMMSLEPAEREKYSIRALEISAKEFNKDNLIDKLVGYMEMLSRK